MRAAACRTVQTVTGLSPAAPMGHAASRCERINDAVYAPPGQTRSTFVEVSLSRNRLMLSVGPPNGVFEAKVPDPPAGQYPWGRLLPLLPSIPGAAIIVRLHPVSPHSPQSRPAATAQNYLRLLSIPLTAATSVAAAV